MLYYLLVLIWHIAYACLFMAEDVAQTPYIAMSGATTPTLVPSTHNGSVRSRMSKFRKLFSRAPQRQTSKPSTSPPPTLNTQIVKYAAQTAQADARGLQCSTPVNKRMLWAIADRKRFIQAVKDLKESNDFLESALRLRSSSDSSIEFTTSPRQLQSEEADDEMQRTQEYLRILHSALVATNSAGMLNFGIKLTSDHQRVKDDINIPKYSFTGDSVIFVLQAHVTCDQEAFSRKSNLLIAETSPTQSVNSCETQQLISELQQYIAPIDAGAGDAFKLLGSLNLGSTSHNNPIVFQDISSGWERRKTLLEYLREDQFADPIHVGQRLELAALLAVSQLQLVTVTLPHRIARAENYVYYDQLSSGSETCDLNILDPYFFAGFGAKPPKQNTSNIGRSTGIAGRFNMRIVGFGLVLYQVGCWKALDFNGDSQLDGLRSVVRKESRKEQCYRLIGLRYAKLVQECLDCKVVSRKELDFLQKLGKSLNELRDEFYEKES